MALCGTQRAWGAQGQPQEWYQPSHSHQDPLANEETLLWKHKALEQGLEAQAAKICALEAAAHSLHRAQCPEAPSTLGRCQAMLLRYLWLWG